MPASSEETVSKRKTRLLRETELAEEFGFKVKTLRNDRSKNQRIPFIRIGSAIFYDPNAVEAALAAMSFPRKGARNEAPK
jgi:hypothetical protein